ncbi:MAG: hypothetical protein PHQ05_04910 [Sterolibacterium sp.]|nr:hypothetical protein [Sterolibacterium sp.]
MIDLIPAPYRMAAAGIAILVAVLASIAAGAWLAARHYEPQIAEANRKSGEMERAYLTLAAATDRQNAAINTLRAEAKRRKEKAESAAIQAQGEAQTFFARGQGILGLKLLPGADPCIAAREAFDDELREERGKR